MKIAIPLKHDPDTVLLDDGRKVSRVKATREGYLVDGPSGEANSKLHAVASWRLAIECLPEARERPSAVAALLANRNPETLSVDAARSILRGLATELIDTTEETMTTDTDPRAARLAEIERSMRAFNKTRGHACKTIRADANDIDPARLKRLAEIRYSAMYTSGRGHTQEAKTLKHALDTHDTTGTPLSRVFAQLGFDASKLLPSNI